MAWGALSLLIMMGIVASSSLHKASMSEEEKIAEFERDARETQEYYREWFLKKEAKAQAKLSREACNPNRVRLREFLTRMTDDGTA